MSGHENGGPAFPIPGRVSHFDEGRFSDEAYAGMTLRDYFAAKAIPVAWQNECHSPTHSADDTPTYQGLAERAYLIADAMLAARGAA